MIIYKKADAEDIDLLTKTRIIVLRSANKLSDDTDMSEVYKTSYDYYKTALSDGTHTAFLVFENEKLIGTGAVSYYKVMPTYHNPTGLKAYIMNMYTDPDYRRRGIAYETLRLLVEDAKSKGVTSISLEATAAGRPLYEKFGFVSMEAEMELPS